MSVSTNTKSLLMAFGAAMALAACGNGADRVVSPGEGAFPPAPPTAPPPTTPPPTTPPPTTGPAANCPTGLTNIGTVANGTLRACQLPSRIVGNLVLSKLAGVAYAISGQTVVGDDMGGDAAAPVAGAQQGTLTIDPGVVLYGSAGADFVLVNRGSQMFAVGTKDQPITFTSRAGLEGGNTADSIGQWGGIILMGRAPINNCQGAVTPGSADTMMIGNLVASQFQQGRNWPFGSALSTLLMLIVMLGISLYLRYYDPTQSSAGEGR